MLAQTHYTYRYANSKHTRSLPPVPSASRSSTSSSTTAAPSRRTHVANYSPLGALLSRNQIPEAVRFLEDSLERKNRVHALAVGDLLEVLCQQGRHDTAWQLLRRLSSSKARLPLQVLHRLLKVAGQHGTVNDVLTVYDHQQQYYGFASTAVQTTLIHALLKAHSKAMPGNLLAYEAWVQLKTSGRHLDAQALLAGIHAAVSVGRRQEAENILAALRETAGAVGRPVVSGYNIIMKSYSATGNFEAARKLFATMKARGLSPDAVTYNTLLTSFVEAGELVRARAVLEKMKREGVRPDEWSYTTYALGLGQQGQLQEMDAVWQEMSAAGIHPNMATYAAAIDAYASAAQPAAAHAILRELLQRQQQQHRQAGEHLQLQQQEVAGQPMQPVQQQRTKARYNGNGNAAAMDAATSSDLQQQPQILSQALLRQLYNTVIKGHLQFGITAPETPAGTSSSSSSSSNNSSSSSNSSSSNSSSSSSSSNSFDEYRALLGDQIHHQSLKAVQAAAVLQPAAADSIHTQAASVTAAVAAAAIEQKQQQQMSGYPAAVAVLEEMGQLGIAPGVDTYTLFINHAIQVGDQGGLQLLLESMAAANIQPDQILLTCLLKAAGLAGDHSAALEIFDALMMAAVPGSSSSSSGSSSSGSAADSMQEEAGSGSGSGDDVGTASRVAQQQQRQQMLGLQQQSSSNGNSNPDDLLAAVNSTSSSGRKPLQDDIQQQSQQRQDPLPKGHEQQLLPLTATAGPDPAAWNALAAVLVQADRLLDAAAAVDRAVQAAQAAGDKTPPIQGFAALIRGYRNAGMKGRAVAALRQFLSLGGKPGRVMCNDVITVCLRDNDLKTARQVVRAMELTGSISDEDIRGYEAWFSRWEARRRATESTAGFGSNGFVIPPGSSNSSSNILGSRDGSAPAAGQAAAVERLKWWLGLPNNYYAAADAAKDSSNGVKSNQQQRQNAQAAGKGRQQ